MAEPKLEEDKVPDDSKDKKKGSNPLQSLLSKKVKIFGREFPMPLLMLGALLIGVVIFMVTKRAGGKSQGVNQEPDNEDLGISEQPSFGIGDRAQGSQQAQFDEFETDLGQNVFTPQPTIQPQPTLSTFEPLPIPELPYSSFGDNFQSIGEFTGQPLPVLPPSQYPVDIPVRDVVPFRPLSNLLPVPPDKRSQQRLIMERKAQIPERPFRPPVPRRPIRPKTRIGLPMPPASPIIPGGRGGIPQPIPRPPMRPIFRPPMRLIRPPVRPPIRPIRPPIRPIRPPVRRNRLFRGRK